VFEQYNNQSWRDSKFWNEENDMVYKWYKPVFDNVFHNYSAKNKSDHNRHLRVLDFA
jgi:hypothetical protein